MMKPSLRNAVVICAAAYVLLAGLFFLARWLLNPPVPQVKFQRSVWLSASLTNTSAPPESYPRRKMTQDLIRHRLVKGMSRHEVRSLLGRPDGGFGLSPKPRNTDYWSLAYTGVGGSDLEKLTVRYNLGGRLVEAEAGYH